MAGIKRRKVGAAKRELRTKSAPAGLPPNLPLIHVTAVGAGREIIECGQLETRPCRIFKRDLTYFFALRPAYRIGSRDSKSDQINRFPFVFVFRSDLLEPPFHVYPFDTGGAVDGVFGDKPDPYVWLEDYELESNLTAISGQIGWAFGSTSEYFDGNLRSALQSELQPWESVLRSYVTIAGLASQGHNQPDKRASAIEVAYGRHVPLKDNAILAEDRPEGSFDLGFASEETWATLPDDERTEMVFFKLGRLRAGRMSMVSAGVEVRHHVNHFANFGGAVLEDLVKQGRVPVMVPSPKQVVKSDASEAAGALRYPDYACVVNPRANMPGFLLVAEVPTLRTLAMSKYPSL